MTQLTSVRFTVGPPNQTAGMRNRFEQTLYDKLGDGPDEQLSTRGEFLNLIGTQSLISSTRFDAAMDVRLKKVNEKILVLR